MNTPNKSLKEYNKSLIKKEKTSSIRKACITFGYVQHVHNGHI